MVNCLFFGSCVAAADEALQLLSDRGSQVLDVLLNFADAVSGSGYVSPTCFEMGCLQR